jgi:CheY-like chemotaxis protein
MLEAGGFDVVITDLGMPGMSGTEVAWRVKAQAPWLPVILLTGWGEMAVEGSAVRTSVDATVGKPVTAEALQRSLAQVVTR